jgi:hypothetical protein
MPSRRTPLFALFSDTRVLVGERWCPYSQPCTEYGARVGRCCFWRSDAEGRQAQSERSPEVADESATGSVFFVPACLRGAHSDQ